MSRATHKKTESSATERIATVPHSWPSSHWNPDVYPNTQQKAKYLVRTYRDELLACGALTRIGRDLVVIGSAYVKWLNKHRAHVPGYEIAPNREGEASAAE